MVDLISLSLNFLKTTLPKPFIGLSNFNPRISQEPTHNLSLNKNIQSVLHSLCYVLFQHIQKSPIFNRLSYMKPINGWGGSAGIIRIM